MGFLAVEFLRVSVAGNDLCQSADPRRSAVDNGESHTPILSFILQKYRITKRVGGGSFGDIYLGVGANGEKVGSAMMSLLLSTKCTVVSTWSPSAFFTNGILVRWLLRLR